MIIKYLIKMWKLCHESLKWYSNLQEGMVALAFSDPHSPQPVHGVRGVFPPKAVLWEALNSAVWVTGALCRTNVCSTVLKCLLRKPWGKLPPLVAFFGCSWMAISPGDANDMSQPSAGYLGCLHGSGHRVNWKCQRTCFPNALRLFFNFFFFLHIGVM